MRLRLKQKHSKILGLPLLEKYGFDENDLQLDSCVINLVNFDLSSIQRLYSIIENQEEKQLFQHIKKTLSIYISIMQDDDTVIMKGLPMFKTALINTLSKFEGNRLYRKIGDKEFCYRVTDIRYVTASSYSRAHVSLSLIYKQFGIIRNTEHSFYLESLGKTIKQVLMSERFLLETKENREEYLESTKKYNKMFPKIGKQHILNGDCNSRTVGDFEFDADRDRGFSYYRERDFEFFDHKVVIDIDDETSGSHRSNDNEINLGEEFWLDPFQERFKRRSWENDEPERKSSDDEDVDNSSLSKKIEIPIHPFITVFNLKNHMRLVTHYSNLTEYKYQDLTKKIVLPNEIRELIGSLIEHKSGGFNDIIQGKSGGAVILLTGRAGVGKTLTAEIFAESKEKPLYNIQASQLGINAIQLEKRLQNVLARASRWDAILLIDEADVYVRERGDDLIQNAIVGVFLRILEYHNSMLFMTTNRPDIVDDAIMSRCIAKIEYKHPTKEEQKQIWRILADTSKIELDDSIIDKFISKHNRYSGRDIKNLLKLGNLKAQSDGKKLDFDILDYVTRFNPTVESKNDNEDDTYV